MSKISVERNLENRIIRINQLWTIFFLLIFIIATLIYIFSILNTPTPNMYQSVPPSYQNSSVTGSVAGVISSLPVNSINNNSSIYIIFLSIIYVFAIFSTFLISLRIKIAQSDREVRNFYKNYFFIKSNKNQVYVFLKEQDKITINWSTKGYFILSHNGEELAYAKSSELYWKILFFQYHLLN